MHFGEDDNYPPEIPYRESTNKNLEFLNKNIILLCLSVILGAVMIAVTVGVTTTFEPTQTPANGMFIFKKLRNLKIHFMYKLRWSKILNFQT